MRPRIGIDLMGSETPPDVLLQAVLEADVPAHLVLFGKQEVVGRLPPSDRFSPFPVEGIVTMDDDPLVAVRRKKESSLCRGISQLAEQKLDAFLSAGNTGALVAAASLLLQRMPGIDRPALLARLPSKKDDIAVLDVGANVTVTSHQLLQFAQMGIALQKSRGRTAPVVGLLNIGTEKGKGREELKEAYERLSTLNRKDSSFLGNVEGRDVFKGEIDVLVTDGFTGNVFLKTSEGIASFILEQLEEDVREKAASPFLSALIHTLRTKLHYGNYPGAILAGVQGLVIKWHGNGTPSALLASVHEAIELIRHRFVDQLGSELGHHS